MMEHKGVLIISQKLLLEKLGLKDVTLLDIRIDHFNANGVQIALEGDIMPECGEGCFTLNIRYEDII